MTDTTHVLHDEVRARYAEAARAAGEGGGCGSGSCCGEPADAAFGRSLYGEDELEDVPALAGSGSLGCGNPTRVVDLQEGDTVLDLGSGGGLDVILSARRVGPTGTAFGLDMTDEMLALALRNAAEADVPNAHFLRGRIEEIPLPSDSVDVVISNCVVNLSPQKEAVLAEIARVLKPGGRIGISDILAEDRLSPADRAERGGWVGCIAGALSVSEAKEGLEAAGLVDVEIELTHVVADGMHAAVLRGRKPDTTRTPLTLVPAAASTRCC